MQIKQICEEKCLQASDVADIVSETGDCISPPTIYKLLSDNSEDLGYQYHTVLTIYEALTAKYGDRPEIEDAQAQQIITEQDKTIDRLLKEYGEREKLYADRKSVFESIIDILKEQIAFKDEEIRRQAALIEKLINKVVD